MVVDVVILAILGTVLVLVFGIMLGVILVTFVQLKRAVLDNDYEGLEVWTLTD